ncbi:MAG: hypothetical protein GY922_11560 [Proteobacteria bacterium]|nr:hypothetical protein [Pseudomonadota bacterium]
MERSREMGFSSFRVIDTIRFGKENRFSYQLPDGTLRDLRPADPAYTDIVSFAGETSSDASRSPVAGVLDSVQCKSELQNRPYIVATGAVSACCWIEGSDDERRMYSRAGVSHSTEHNIRNRLLEEILLEEPYRTIYPEAWEAGSNPVCIRKCAKMQRSRRRAL